MPDLFPTGIRRVGIAPLSIVLMITLLFFMYNYLCAISRNCGLFSSYQVLLDSPCVLCYS